MPTGAPHSLTSPALSREARPPLAWARPHPGPRGDRTNGSWPDASTCTSGTLPSPPLSTPTLSCDLAHTPPFHTAGRWPDASGAPLDDGSDRYRPLPLQTPDRVRAKSRGEMAFLHHREGKGVGMIASTDRDRPALRIAGCPIQTHHIYRGERKNSSIYRHKCVRKCGTQHNDIPSVKCV